jgi:hypothetical protein
VDTLAVRLAVPLAGPALDFHQLAWISTERN